ncbi:MAG: Hsp20/alpha crystallin family protein [Ketobacteraceae bacterium]|nr:Hsp20/alpha crystallin family protein [Ketobacteraceae bacterium]
MNLEKLKPWNWFKHEDSTSEYQVPVTRSDRGSGSGRHQTANLVETNPAFGLPGLQRLQRELDQFFGDQPMASPFFGKYRAMLDVSVDDDQYEISVEVPGMSRSDLSIDVSDGTLTIRGTKEVREENKDKHFYRIERSYGSFQRMLALPDDANEDEINARLKDGVLTLVIPRREPDTRSIRKISISGQ